MDARIDYIGRSRALPGLAALGSILLLSGCFPGAADQTQGVVVADIAEEGVEE
ncbi:hypothetical protein [Roseovarius aestuariivivens]|uniref:hypothetical protein n=1 Tax=Roseovarius aestuariivivens TaxID=1888910 RepID=UPI001436719E|nr:hypothetical protein [Roseovarius aestuariivivens]